MHVSVVSAMASSAMPASAAMLAMQAWQRQKARIHASQETGSWVTLAGMKMAQGPEILDMLVNSLQNNRPCGTGTP